MYDVCKRYGIEVDAITRLMVYIIILLIRFNLGLAVKLSV